MDESCHVGELVGRPLPPLCLDNALFGGRSDLSVPRAEALLEEVNSGLPTSNGVVFNRRDLTQVTSKTYPIWKLNCFVFAPCDLYGSSSVSP